MQVQGKGLFGKLPGVNRDREKTEHNIIFISQRAITAYGGCHICTVSMQVCSEWSEMQPL